MYFFYLKVIDDENSTEVTEGAIVTVIVTLVRKNMSTLFGDETVKDNNITNENGIEPEAVGDAAPTEAEPQVKRPAWLKQKRGGGKKSKKAPKPKSTSSNVVAKPKVEESPVPEKKKVKEEKVSKQEEESDESDVSDAETNDKTSEDESEKKSANEDDDQEWEKFRKSHEQEKALQGKSKSSHEVHCPYFPNDKQEYWWTYICDRKSKTLLTMPHYVTSLVDQEVVHLKV